MDERDRLVAAVRDARNTYDRALAGVGEASRNYSTAVLALVEHEETRQAKGARARVAALLGMSWPQVQRHLAKASAPAPARDRERPAPMPSGSCADVGPDGFCRGCQEPPRWCTCTTGAVPLPVDAINP